MMECTCLHVNYGEEEGRLKVKANETERGCLSKKNSGNLGKRA